MEKNHELLEELERALTGDEWAHEDEQAILAQMRERQYAYKREQRAIKRGRFWRELPGAIVALVSILLGYAGAILVADGLVGTEDKGLFFGVVALLGFFVLGAHHHHLEKGMRRSPI